MKIVIDTNVVASAIFFGGQPRRLLELLLERKWYCSLVNGVNALYMAVSHRIADRVKELADRYGQTMPELDGEVAELESKVKSHLIRMGFTW